MAPKTICCSCLILLFLTTFIMRIITRQRTVRLFSPKPLKKHSEAVDLSTLEKFGDKYKEMAVQQWRAYRRRKQIPGAITNSSSHRDYVVIVKGTDINCQNRVTINVDSLPKCTQTGPLLKVVPSCVLKHDALSRVSAIITESFDGNNIFRGGSHIQAELVAGSDVYLCLVTDNFDGTYTVECPPSNGQVIFRVMLMHVAFRHFYRNGFSSPRCLLLIAVKLLTAAPATFKFYGWKNGHLFREGQPFGRPFNKSCILQNAPLIFCGMSHMRYLAKYFTQFLNTSTTLQNVSPPLSKLQKQRVYHLALAYVRHLPRFLPILEKTIKSTNATRSVIMLTTGSYDLSEDPSESVIAAAPKFANHLKNIRMKVGKSPRIIYITIPPFPEFYHYNNRGARTNMLIAVQIFYYKRAIRDIASQFDIEILDVFEVMQSAAHTAMPRSHFIEGLTNYGPVIHFSTSGEYLAHIIASKICRTF